MPHTNYNETPFTLHKHERQQTLTAETIKELYNHIKATTHINVHGSVITITKQNYETWH